MTGPKTWRAWLLTDTPTSRGMQNYPRLYQGWLSFRSNTMAMVGLWILILSSADRLCGARARPT